MNKIRTILALIACTAMSWAADLGIKLDAFKVVPATATTAESFVAADAAAPGDIIEYRATYTNATASMLRNFLPEIPVPAGLTLIEGSDQPKASLGSLDGNTFSALPLLGADGRPVPAASIRALRWNVANLAVGETVTLRVRASVNR